MAFNITENTRCGVIGYGSWATALVHILVKNKVHVWWHIRNEEVMESLMTDGVNSKYLSEVEFDKNYISPVSDINEVVRNAEVVLIATPSAFLKNVMEDLTESLENKFILSATKGIIADDYTTITEYFNQAYNLPYSQLGVISGPSHAEEVAMDRLSYLTVACKDEDNARKVGDMFKNNNFMLSLSTDIYGIEYAAVLKNIYALAGGLAAGLGYGDNFRAVLTAACAKELTRFVNESYPFERDTMNSAYLGDLLVTTYSSFSRNRRLGQLIGHGHTVKSALNEMTMVAEGYYAAACIKKVNEKHNIEMPIADMVYDILYRRFSARKRMKELTALL
ncbi:MAG: NAD(P)H-dependent glycerol-3-phosphate dehydrogenase [Bacteroidales bacterium]|nr:NAD(P)H-dependent glycerol-3-phosphate dehydrogenase [Bacteroidales bacterium]MBR5861874.1 NAD(P)H-dependent glycerol-3-phosphate dehydrogenase [Bacteroidales bacterium]